MTDNSKKDDSKYLYFLFSLLPKTKRPVLGPVFLHVRCVRGNFGRAEPGQNPANSARIRLAI